jgi:hypothetical protein
MSRTQSTSEKRTGNERRPVTPSIKAQCRALYANGNGIPLTRIADLLRVPVGDVQKIVNRVEPEQVI